MGSVWGLKSLPCPRGAVNKWVLREYSSGEGSLGVGRGRLLDDDACGGGGGGGEGEEGRGGREVGGSWVVVLDGSDCGMAAAAAVAGEMRSTRRGGLRARIPEHSQVSVEMSSAKVDG